MNWWQWTLLALTLWCLVSYVVGVLGIRYLRYRRREAGIED